LRYLFSLHAESLKVLSRVQQTRSTFTNKIVDIFEGLHGLVLGCVGVVDELLNHDQYLYGLNQVLPTFYSFRSMLICYH